MDTKFYGPKFLDQYFSSPIPFGLKIFTNAKIFWTNFLVKAEVEKKLKWITSKNFMTNSEPFKSALRLFQSCTKLDDLPFLLVFLSATWVCTSPCFVGLGNAPG